MSNALANWFEEVIGFVMAGVIFEVLYFKVLPEEFASQHFSLPYAILFWGILVVAIVAIGLGDLGHVMKRGFPFSLGVIFFAYYSQDWYSLVVAIIGVILSVILR